ncbi:MAG TPA: hypothetical protein VFR18_17580 [Terriglobia bacterium]|nr:hypothetical protein [Terriglobia bacterium]
MRRTNLKRNNSICTVLVAVCIFGFVVGSAFAQSAQSATSTSDSYQWSAELVAFDEPMRMLTVKASAVGEAQKQLAAFKAGDKILLNWSGFDKYASAVNGAWKQDATRKAEDRFSFPAEFVTFDASRNYVTFKVPAPAEATARLKSIKPGEWVTATSKHGHASVTQPLVAVRGYNDPETTTSK